MPTCSRCRRRSSKWGKWTWTCPATTNFGAARRRRGIPARPCFRKRRRCKCCMVWEARIWMPKDASWRWSSRISGSSTYTRPMRRTSWRASRTAWNGTTRSAISARAWKKASCRQGFLWSGGRASAKARTMPQAVRRRPAWRHLVGERTMRAPQPRPVGERSTTQRPTPPRLQPATRPTPQRACW